MSGPTSARTTATSRGEHQPAGPARPRVTAAGARVAQRARANERFSRSADPGR